MKELNTFELIEKMKDDPDFLGVFPIDKLPKNPIPTKLMKLIANLDPANLGGSHWVAMLVNNGQGLYFDSFGRLPPMEAQQWLTLNSTQWSWNPMIVQLPSDNILCGHLCIAFLKKF